MQSTLFEDYDLSTLGIVPSSLISFEMGTDDISLTCTYGKISLVIEKPVDDFLIGLIIKKISQVQPSTTHDLDVFCKFDEIHSYQKKGFILVSYGKSQDKYHVSFNVPFSSEKALFNLSLAIFKESSILEHCPFKKDFYWNGTDNEIARLFFELKCIDGWKVKSVRNKESLEKPKGSPELKESLEKPESSELKESLEKPESSEFKESLEKPESSELKESLEKPESSEFKESLEKPESSEFKESLEKPESSEFKESLEKPKGSPELKKSSEKFEETLEKFVETPEKFEESSDNSKKNSKKMIEESF